MKSASRSPSSLFLSLSLAAAGCRGAGGNNLQAAAGAPSADPLDFGEVPLGEPTVLSLAITNVGLADITLLALVADAAGPDFSGALPRTALMAGQTLVAQVTFTPAAAGRRSSNLGLAYVQGNGASAGTPPTVYRVAVSGTGVPASQVTLEVQPSHVDFGAVLLQEFEQRTVYVKNLNGFAVTLDAFFDGGPPSGLLVADGGQPTLPPGGFTALPVAFAPTLTGDVAGLWQIGACPACPHQAVAVTGTGVDAQLVFEPASVDFGFVLNTTQAAPVTVTARVRGNSPLAITAPPSAGLNSVFSVSGFSVPALPWTLSADAGTAVSFQVGYSPSAAPAGDFGQISLPVSVQGASSVATLKVAGNLLAGGCQLDIHPNSQLSFGAIAPGSYATSQLAVLNTGAAPCELGALQFAPGSDPAFSLAEVLPDGGQVPFQASSTVPPHGQLGLQGVPVTFAAPHNSPRNHFQATLTFASNDPARAQVSLGLRASVQGAYLTSSQWPRLHHDNFNSSQSEADTSAFDGGLLWAFSLLSPASTALPQCASGAGGLYGNGPVVGLDGLVYQLGCDGTFYALSGDNGVPQWTAALAPPSRLGFATAAVAPDGLIALTYDSANRAQSTGSDPITNPPPALFQLDGHQQRLLATANTGLAPDYTVEPIVTAPSFALDGTLFTALDTGFVADLGFNASPQVVVLPPHQVLAPAALARLGVDHLTGFDGTLQSLRTPAPALDDDDTAVWCAYGTCTRFSAPAGHEAELWSTSLGSEDFSRGTGSAVLGRDQVFVYAFGYGDAGQQTDGGQRYVGSLQALDKATGSLAWRAELPSLPVPTPDPYAAPAVLSLTPALSSAGTLVLQYVDGIYGIAAGGPQAGLVLWKISGHGGLGSPSLDAAGRAYVGTFRDGLLAIDTQGQPSAARYAFQPPPGSGGPVGIASNPAVTAAAIYFTADDGNAYAIH